jgi:hypothetical protein
MITQRQTFAALTTAAVVLAASFCTTNAITIEFEEPTAENLKTTVKADVPNCGSPPCQARKSEAEEMARIILNVPRGTFGANVSARAVLLEPPNEVPGGLAISDLIVLTVIFPAQQNQPEGVVTGFRSDNESTSLGSIPANFPQALRLPEDGTSQNLVFFTGTFEAPTPFKLPEGFIIKAQSDVVPEPATFLLVASVLAILGAIYWRRQRGR